MADAFTRIDKALAEYYTICGRKGYYDDDGNGKFMLFVEDGEFEVDDVEDELGDDATADDCQYMEMDDDFPLTDEHNDIFAVIQYCYKHGEPPNKKQIQIDSDSEQKDPPWDMKDFDINVTPQDLDIIEQQLMDQCGDLRPQNTGNSDQDRATYTIIQIGKQNRNLPLLIYLMDSYNRYRIQKRKTTLKKLKRKALNQNGLRILFDKHFTDPKPFKFIREKCGGISKHFVPDHTAKEQETFMNMCQAAISVFPHRLVHKPPTRPRAALIKDNLVDISRYIFQTYTFIQQFCSQKHAPLPAQIDVVIIPKEYDMIQWDDSDGKMNPSDDDGEDGANEPLNVGNIGKRLAKQENSIKQPEEIEYGTANRTMLQVINSLFDQKRCQRGILVIDRRNDFKKDQLYGFQPNESPNKEKRCHDFQSDINILLVEALMQNLRVCILPKVDDEKENITVNTQKPFGLTLSFHCFAVDEVRVYLCNNGWGGRFFIEDIKYFLPIFFVDGERDKLETEFTNVKNRDFRKMYMESKLKCTDPKFEKFYTLLFDDDKHRSH